MLPTREFFSNLYDAFNRRDIEIVLSMMTEDVKWANGMEGGFVYGRENVREYWRRQFEVINPQLQILNIESDSDNRVVVSVHQIVKDLDGNLLADKTVKQIFTFDGGLIKTFEIGEAEWRF
jgi:ketosteroid isomerase-like protein